MNLAEGLAFGHQDKIVIFGGIATHPDINKMTSASCSHVREEDNGKDKDVSNSSSKSSDNEDRDDLHRGEAILRLNGNSSKNKTNSSVPYFSRNILTITFDDQVKKYV